MSNVANSNGEIPLGIGGLWENGRNEEITQRNGLVLKNYDNVP